MTRNNAAMQYFDSGFDCCRAVLNSFSEVLNFSDSDMAECKALYSILPGNPHPVCGAVRGGQKVIKLIDEQYLQGKSRKALEEEFRRHFYSKYKTLRCSTLIGFDVSNAQDFAEFQNYEEAETKCRGYVSEAVNILNTMLGITNTVESVTL